MPVRYNGPDGPSELIPAPFVNIQKNFIRDEGETRLHAEYVFTLTGTIVNVGTSVDSPDATTDTMEGILAEQARIRRLFSVDGGRLEIETPGGGGPNTIDAYCLVDSIDFAQGVWVNRCDYTIVLRSRNIEVDDDSFAELASRSESWSINHNDDGTAVITHQLSANGQVIYGPSGSNDPLEAARQWCRQRAFTTSSLGVLSLLSASGVDSLDMTQLVNGLSSDSANYWNYASVENVGTTNHSWQLTETFVHNPSGNTREEFSASLAYENDNPRRLNITANGLVLGYADKSSNWYQKISNAKTKFLNGVEPNLYTRMLTYVPNGYTISPVPTVRQVTYEEKEGSVRYSFGFTAVSGTLISGCLDENISVSDIGSTDVFAQISVPGRRSGPVIQNMQTVTAPERTVSINATMLADTTALTTSSLTSLYAAKPNTDAIVNALKPSAGYYYIKQNSEEWNPIKRQYSRVVSWTINNQGSTVVGIPSGIHNT